MTLEEYRACLSFNRRNFNSSVNSDTTTDKNYNKKKYRRIALLRYYTDKANCTLVKATNADIYTVVTSDGLARTFDDLDATFDYVYRYLTVKQIFIDS